MTIQFSELAELRLRNFIRASSKEDAEQRGVRLALKDGGCSGYEYSLDIVNEPKTDDLHFDQGKLRVYVDRNSAPLLEGVLVDYVEGLTYSGFKFSNPNATDTCGCGKSFSAGDCTPSPQACS